MESGVAPWSRTVGLSTGIAAFCWRKLRKLFSVLSLFNSENLTSPCTDYFLSISVVDLKFDLFYPRGRDIESQHFSAFINPRLLPVLFLLNRQFSLFLKNPTLKAKFKKTA
jgi:hypothetical protein